MYLGESWPQIERPPSAMQGPGNALTICHARPDVDAFVSPLLVSHFHFEMFVTLVKFGSARCLKRSQGVSIVHCRSAPHSTTEQHRLMRNTYAFATV